MEQELKYKVGDIIIMTDPNTTEGAWAFGNIYKIEDYNNEQWNIIPLNSEIRERGFSPNSWVYRNSKLYVKPKFNHKAFKKLLEDL